MIENVTCPECDGPMVSRKRKSDGARFWGCAAFPRCKGTRDVDGRSAREKVRGMSDEEYEDRVMGVLPSDRARGNDRGRW